MSSNDDFEFYFNMLYTFYSVPNIILPFFGGGFVDRIGSSFCLAAFSSLCLLGQIVFSIGSSSKSWNVMILGRLIYGLGGESITVAQSALMAQWFSGNELALSFGISLAISRMGSVLNNMASPIVANKSSTPAALWVGVGVNVLSLMFGMCAVYIHNEANRKISEENRASALLTASLLEDHDVSLEEEEEYALLGESASIHVDTRPLLLKEDPNNSSTKPQKVRLSDVKSFGILFWLLSISCFVVYGCVLPFNNVASGILLERNYFMSPPETCTLAHPDECTLGTLQIGSNPSTDQNGDTCPTQTFVAPVLPSSLNITDANTQQDDISSWRQTQYIFNPLFSDHVDCGDPFWSDDCIKNYCSAQNDATETAAMTMSIPYVLSATLSPFLGLLVDRIGCRAIIATLAPTVLLVVHLTMAFSRSSPIVPMIGQGLAYSMYASALWPSIPIVIPSKFTGTAFGVVMSIQNIGLATFPLIVALIYNRAQRYIPNVELFFALCAALGIAVGVYLNVVDGRMGGKLNRSQKDAVVMDGASCDNIDYETEGYSYPSSSLVLETETELDETYI